MKHTAQYWIRKLKLRPHPEGGYYRETYRARLQIPQSTPGSRRAGSRASSTAIYFLLRRPDFSAFHRLRSDELWFLHDGGAVRLHLLRADGRYERLTLGTSAAGGAAPQAIIPARTWFAAEIVAPGRHALVSCTVSPGFDFADFELADRRALCRRFPALRRLITRLTR